MEKSLFHRFLSFSNKVFYPVAYIMNGLQHLTIPTSLKFCLALCCTQAGPNFFHLVKEMASTILETERTLNPLVAMATTVLRTFQETFLPSLVQICPEVWEENMFKEIVDDARHTQNHPKSSP